MQMAALSALFDSTVLLVPCAPRENPVGEKALEGHNLSVVPLSFPRGIGLKRKLDMPVWLARNGPALFREFRRADAVHTPIPGDVGTVGMLLAFLFRKPLFVRHCGNWFVQRTVAERFWKWFMQRFAGGRNVMVATGGPPEAPRENTPEVRWIFSTSLTEQQLSRLGMVRDSPSANGPRLILVGRQEYGKGTDKLIECIPLLVNDCPHLQLDVVGDGTALPEFRQLACSLGIADHVHFHGALEHARVLNLLQTGDLFCFPTASEGFPKAVLEALACGLPVVTTKVSVLPRLIGTGCGVVIEEPTAPALAQGIRHCLADEERYRKMSRQAVATARPYSLERWRDSIAVLLREAWGELQKTNGRSG